MKRQTSMEWLEQELQNVYQKEWKLPIGYTLHLLGQAKKMNEEEIKEAYNDGHEDADIKSGVYDGFDIRLSTLASEYYEKKFKNEQHG